ncbi:ACT domain-containing protein [Carboxydocella sp. ULO1]|uniref:ACT domain-containing protein n=1 Tax=Carboxydocella sp. ULO1 TaxID=1926599 RepID=UPI0009AE3EA7|nr:ACT domain-containing protein [Carboxydocella sp. ULO1]GAW28476.1 amino acid-binding protein [Carboxydocella sp. ULO1]
MKIKQISLFLENKAGRLVRVTEILAQHQINIRALSLADTSDFGILRLIVNDPETAYQVLKAAGFAVSITEVLAVEIDDTPGGLNAALSALQAAGLNIEYVYAFVEKATDKAVVVFRVEELERAIQALAEAGINTLRGEEVYNL